MARELQDEIEALIADEENGTFEIWEALIDEEELFGEWFVERASDPEFASKDLDLVWKPIAKYLDGYRGDSPVYRLEMAIHDAVDNFPESVATNTKFIDALFKLAAKGEWYGGPWALAKVKSLSAEQLLRIANESELPDLETAQAEEKLWFDSGYDFDDDESHFLSSYLVKHDKFNDEIALVLLDRFEKLGIQEFASNTLTCIAEDIRLSDLVRNRSRNLID